MLPRPPFEPRPCLDDDAWGALVIDSGETFVPVCACPAGFAQEFFAPAAAQLIAHPEYNSTLILRSDVLSDTVGASDDDDNDGQANTDFDVKLPPEAPRLRAHRPVRVIRRRLLPRRPGRDPPLDQLCAFYADIALDGSHDDEVTPPPVSCVVLTPILAAGAPMPYYHPAVAHLAFRYLAPQFAAPNTTSELSSALLRVEIIPLPSADPPAIDPNSRLYRTALSLLDTLHRYGWGARTYYRKRVAHDVLVPREVYQDLYLRLRERHRHWVHAWHEATDPLKHVYEDVGIATYLMLLWKQGQFARDDVEHVDDREKDREEENGDAELMPWHSWPRPPGGFVDLGCGNGLLVHILTAEGYAGVGLDVRSRVSWAHYPEKTRKRLHVAPLDPLALFPEPEAGAGDEQEPSKNSIEDDEGAQAPDEQHQEKDPTTALVRALLRPGAFLIANHADELSPWAPVLGAFTGASGYLSIPCCAWSLDARFVRAQLLVRDASTAETRTKTPFALGPPPGAKSFDAFVEALKLGSDVQLSADGGGARGGGGSAYAAYRAWLACLGAHCGWGAPAPASSVASAFNSESESGSESMSASTPESTRASGDGSTLKAETTAAAVLFDQPECDVLRIPSTRNWAIVGRARCADPVYADNARVLVQAVRERGIFATRRPEGKAGVGH